MVASQADSAGLSLKKRLVPEHSAAASAAAAAAAAAAAGTPRGACVLLDDVPEPYYNSTRLPGSDRLDSSDVALTFSVSARFVGALAAARSAGRVGRRAPADADVLAGLVHGEVLYHDGTLPLVFVDGAGADGEGVLSPLPPLALRCALDGHVLSVTFRRALPISSAHAGRKFMLSFALGDEVVRTRAFAVLAKKAKMGVPAKVRVTPEVVSLSDARAALLRPLDTLVSQLPAIGLADALADRFIKGQRIVLDTASRAPLQRAPAGPVRVYRGARLLGIADFAPPGLLAPQRVLVQATGE